MGALSDAYLESLKPKENSRCFEIEGIDVVCKPSDYESMETLIKSMNSIPTGRSTLDEMKKYNTPLYLMDDMGRSAGCYTPSENKISLNKSTGIDKMRSCLVHEARHLWQDHAGRGAYENQELDYETVQMIYRATEADAQSQAYQACVEWDALGDKGPKQAFDSTYTQIAAGYKKDGIAGAYRGWYDDERITAAYENGYDISPAIYSITHKSFSTGEYHHGLAKDVKSFCGGDKVPDFETFVNSDHAKQIHRITKSVLDVYNVVGASVGISIDDSVDRMPLRNLEKNSADQMYSDKYIQETREDLSKKCSFSKMEDKPLFMSMLRTVDAVEKVCNAEKNGKKDLNAEQVIEDEKLYLFMAKKIRSGIDPEIIDKVELPKNVSTQLKKDSEVLFKSCAHMTLDDSLVSYINYGLQHLNYKKIAEANKETKDSNIALKIKLNKQKDR